MVGVNGYSMILVVLNNGTRLFPTNYR